MLSSSLHPFPTLPPSVGSVALIGAGPGDPELLTLKAHRLLQQADVVLYDNLVSAEIIALLPATVERLYVGKSCGHHAMSQQRINRLMIERARRGQRVCRLKGGDAFIFGRGGEELEALFAAEIPFSVVPGITAAAGCAAYAGIPLTHRDYAQEVAFITGHRREGQPLELEWAALVSAHKTLVFYMGLKNLQLICQRLMAHGMAPAMPAALVENGTRAEQRVITGCVGDLHDRALAANATAPSLLIIGRVVALQTQLAWFKPHTEGDDRAPDCRWAQCVG